MGSPWRLKRYTATALMFILLLQSRGALSWSNGLGKEEGTAMNALFVPLPRTDFEAYGRDNAPVVDLYSYNTNNKRASFELDNSAEDPENRYVVPSSSGPDVMRKRTLSLFSRWKSLDELRRNMALPFYSRHQRKPILAQGIEASHKATRGATIVHPVSRGYYRSLRPLGQPLRWG